MLKTTKQKHVPAIFFFFAFQLFRAQLNALSRVSEFKLIGSLVVHIKSFFFVCLSLFVSHITQKYIESSRCQYFQNHFSTCSATVNVLSRAFRLSSDQILTQRPFSILPQKLYNFQSCVLVCFLDYSAIFFLFVHATTICSRRSKKKENTTSTVILKKNS